MHLWLLNARRRFAPVAQMERAAVSVPSPLLFMDTPAFPSSIKKKTIGLI